jgi:hypothetical protein
MQPPGIGPAQADGFEEPEYNRFALEQELTVDELVRLASSWSPVAVRALATRTADAEGRVVFGYVTDCYRYRRA